MKKILFILLGVLMLASVFCGCTAAGVTVAPEQSAPAEPEQSAPAEPAQSEEVILEPEEGGDESLNVSEGHAYLDVKKSDLKTGSYSFIWVEITGEDEDLTITPTGKEATCTLDGSADIITPYTMEDCTIPDIADIRATDAAGLARFVEAWIGEGYSDNPLFFVSAVDDVVVNLEYVYTP